MMDLMSSDLQPAGAEPTPQQSGGRVRPGRERGSTAGTAAVERHRRGRRSRRGPPVGAAGRGRGRRRAVRLADLRVADHRGGHRRISTAACRARSRSRPASAIWARSAPATWSGCSCWSPRWCWCCSGRRPVRRYARLLGLSTGGVLLGLLAALSTPIWARRVARSSGSTSLLESTRIRPELTYGRGHLVCGVRCGGDALALYLAGRHAPPGGGRRPSRRTRNCRRSVWSWRRPPRPDEDEERPPDEPFDLTVVVDEAVHRR